VIDVVILVVPLVVVVALVVRDWRFKLSPVHLVWILPLIALGAVFVGGALE
jgi:hypothetical protein